MLVPPVQVQRPERVARLPAGGGHQFSVKVDGWRVVAFAGGDGVRLQARSGRIVTDRFPEILRPLAAAVPAGSVLDGELCAVRGGVFDFHLLAGTAAKRAREGAALSFVAFDLLQDGATGTDLRGRPFAERWARLLELLADAPAQVQPVMATEGRDEAKAWMKALAPIGVEGIVAKSLQSTYRAGTGHGWIKVRTEDTVDADVLDAVGGNALRVRLEGGQEAVTQPLGPSAVREVAEALEAGVGPLRIEVRAGHGRHGQVRFVRVRPPE